MRSLREWLSPEALLVLGASRRDADPATLQALITPEFRWPLVEAFTQRQFAAPSVNALVQRLPGGLVPADVLQRFGKAAMVSEFRQRCLENALHEAVGVMSQAGVRVTLLKGAALAVTIYPAFRARGMQDLDLLVRPEDEDRAWNALLAAGWQPTASEQMAPFFDRHHHRAPLVSPRLGYARVELHTRLFHGQGPVAFTADDVRRDAVEVALGAESASVPSNEHSLLYLCLHFVWSHAMSRGLLRTVLDLEALAQAGVVMDERFVRLASEARAATCCYWTARLGQHLYDVPVAADVLAALRPPRPAWLLDLLERHYVGVSGLTPQPCPSVQVEQALWSLGVMPGRSGHRELPWSAGQEWDVASRAGAPDGGGWARRLGAVRALPSYAAKLLR